MAYTFSVNNAPANGAIAIYTLITTLITAGWIKKMDSDGTTYSSTGVQVTGSGTGTNGFGNTSAWIRLQSPATNGGSVLNQTRELIFQRGTTDLVWRIKYSASAGFTGGSPAGAVVPSSTDEVYMTGAGTDAAPTYTSWFGVNGTYRWHVGAGGADEFYSFYAISVANSQTVVSSSSNTCMFLDIMAPGSYSPLDVDPAVIYFSSATGTAALSEIITTVAVTVNIANPSKARAWFGATSAAAGAIVGHNNCNVSLVPYGSSVGGTGIVGTNPWSDGDDLLPALYVNKNIIPPCGIKGFSTLLMFGSMQHVNMFVIDTVTTGTRDKIFFQNVWLPWSGAVPLI